MNPSPTPQIPYLDGWRGLAILGVLIGHFILRPSFAWMANFGVQLFFALSGYLMANLLFIRQVGMADFFARRFSRVLPTFLLFVLAMYVFAATLQSTPYKVPASELLATLAFLRTYLPAGESIWSTPWSVGHLWSLNVEEHSYVFLAVGAVLTRARSGHVAAGAFLLASVAAVIAFCLYYADYPPAGASPWYLRSECAALALIAAAAIRVVRHATPFTVIKTVPRLMPILWLVLAGACISTYKHRGGQYIVAPLCLALATNYLDCVPGMMRKALAHPVLTWFGKCSFSLYLWQQPFFNAANKLDIDPLLGCAIGILLGAISYYAFESPLRSMLNSAWTKRKLASRPPVGPLAL